MSEAGEWSFAAVHDVVAATAPDRDMVVCGDGAPDLRRGGRADQVDRRLPAGRAASASTASAPSSNAGRAARTPWRWCCTTGPSTSRPCSGAFRARAVPFNVNQHYRPAEVRALLADIGVRAVVYHRRYRPLVETACDGRDGRARRRRRRLGHRTPARQHRLRGGGGHPGRRSVAGDVARRPVPRVHRRHHGTAQGGAVAPGRHLRLGHGRHGGRDGRVDRRRPPSGPAPGARGTRSPR